MQWQHRTCGSGVTREAYWAAVKEGMDVNWMCGECSSEGSGTPEILTATPFDESRQSVDAGETSATPVDDPTPRPTVTEDDIAYEKVSSSSQRGQHKLVDSLGYTYTLKRKTNIGLHWRCSVRNKNTNCGATVKETAENYVRSHIPHCHPPESCPAIKSKVSALVKKKAVEDVFRSAADIVDEVLCTEVDPNKPLSSLPAPYNLARQGNRKRRTARPPEPLDLSFEISHAHIPENFLRYDISVGGRRHLIFATEEQLSLLSKANHWYADATFKIVRRPFTQLFSIHTFVQSDKNLKQVPLLFALMSGKRRRDYKKVFAKTKDVLGGELKVKEITVDFEASMWNAIPEILPDVIIRGCSFHWGQAVWRKIQEIGLQVPYTDDVGTHKFLRKVLALPYVPAEHIEELFIRFYRKANDSHALITLLDYIKNTWIHSDIWPPRAWCVFGRSIRTNNDLEGWHNRLNRKARKGQLNFYLLIKLISDEAKLVTLQVRLLSDGKVLRRQRLKYAKHHGQLVKLWEEYNAGERSARSLLKACSYHIAVCT